MISKEIFNPILSDLLDVEKRLDDFATTSELPLLSELLAHTFKSKGKRTRPALTLLTSGFHTHDKSKVILMATAVEMLHVATLIHDDIVDEANTRRGRITVSNAWGNHTAVLLGDYVFAASATYVCDTGNIRVVKLFSETIMDLSRGELQESAHAHGNAYHIDEYLERIHFKTGSLFATAGESGAILSGASESEVTALKNYSHKLGLAFQIIDDIMDFKSDAAFIGKPVGQDIYNGVVTLPLIYESEKPKSKILIDDFLQRSNDKDLHKKILASVNAGDSLNRAYKFAEDLMAQACNELDIFPDNTYRQSLVALAQLVLKRDY